MRKIFIGFFVFMAISPAHAYDSDWAQRQMQQAQQEAELQRQHTQLQQIQEQQEEILRQQRMERLREQTSNPYGYAR